MHKNISGFLLATVALVVACSVANDESAPVKLEFDESMSIFNKGDSQKFGLPTVFVFDSDRKCVATASNRTMYGDAFRKQIQERKPVCPELDLVEIETRTSIVIKPGDGLTFLLLTESGDYCTACADIIDEFETLVLKPLGDSYSVHWIDIGMTEWFSGNHEK